MNNYIPTNQITQMKKNSRKTSGRSVISKEIELVFKIFPKRKTQDQMALPMNSTKHLKEN